MSKVKNYSIVAKFENLLKARGHELHELILIIRDHSRDSCNSWPRPFRLLVQFEIAPADDIEA